MKCDEGGFLGLVGWGGGGSKEGRIRAAWGGTRRGYVPVGSTPASLRVMVPHLAARFLRCHSPRYFGVSASASCQPQRRLRYVRVASTPASLRVMHTLLPSSCCAHPATPRSLLPTARSRKAACKTITDRMSVLSPHGWVHGVSCSGFVTPPRPPGIPPRTPPKIKPKRKNLAALVAAFAFAGPYCRTYRYRRGIISI